MSDTTTQCKQCDRAFVPKSKVNVFCSRQCQLDYRARRSADESARRNETGFAWPPVAPAPALTVKVPRATPRPGKWRTAVVLPDQQFGYRQLLDGTFQSFHDERALHIAEQVIEVERPHLTVMLGDVLDLPAHGRYRQEPSFVTTTQRAIDRASRHIATVAALSRETRVLEGNHDARLSNYVLDNALASAGLRQARRQPGDYPPMTVPHLLNIADMPNTKWVGGYPSGATYVNENLAAIHGRRTGRNMLDRVLDDERVSVVFGHVHRIVAMWQTRNTRTSPKFNQALSPGCLCRIDGTVPSARAGLDPWIAPPRSWEDWQQGLAVVRYEPGDGRFHVEMVPIIPLDDRSWALHRGQEFVSKKEFDPK